MRLQAKKQSKANTVMIGGHFEKEVSKQLRILAAEEDTSQVALLGEALDFLFVKKGKKKLAQMKNK